MNEIGQDGLPPALDAPSAEYLEAQGRDMHALIAQLYPLCRSITGDGVRETLRHVGSRLPLSITEVPSGTAVFDWSVPPEWNIRDAYIKDSDGHRVVDFQAHNLHVVGYSVPVRTRLSGAELDGHLFSLPEQPDRIPYRTSYYKEFWGFCVTEQQRAVLEAGSDFEVVIDSDLGPGSLTYGECLLPGESDEEVLIFTHVCHPSLCNDNLSGIALATAWASHLQSQRLRYSYRFVFAPATIGSITWLARNEDRLASIRHGLVLADVGDRGSLTYKCSRRGNAAIDRAAAAVLGARGLKDRILPFSPWGYDERQFGSPGIDLPVGRLTRTPNGCFPEYHTSGDDLDLVAPEALADSLDACLEITRIIESDRRYRNLAPKGEPQLGRRGLYRSMGGYQDAQAFQLAMLWVLNLSDGGHGLLEIAERAELSFDLVDNAAVALETAGLLQRLDM